MSKNTNQMQVIEVIGFGRRFVASIIDGLLVLFISTFIAVTIGVGGIMLGTLKSEGTTWNQFILVSVLFVSLIYYIGMWTKSEGQTVGKVWLGIQIVPKEGGSLSLGKAILRYIGYLLSGIVASIGFFWVAVDKKRRGWHDMLAGTYVISANHDMPKEGAKTFQASDQSSGWVWAILWFILAVGIPASLFSGLWFLGPGINKFITNLLSGLGL